MSGPPPAPGGKTPFWWKGEWWQEQPDGTLRRWSGYQETWVEDSRASQIDRRAAAKATRKASSPWRSQRSPLVLLGLVGALITVGSILVSLGGAENAERGGIFITIALLIGFFFAIKWLLDR